MACTRKCLPPKRDLAELDTRLVREIAQNRIGIAAISERIAGTLARIADTRSNLIKWMLAALTAQTALLLGALRLF